MADDLINYINEEKAKGTPRETIRSALVSSGWDAKEADKGLDSVFGLEKPAEPSKEIKTGAKTRSPLLKFLPLIILAVILAAGAAVYFTLFYSTCPKLTEPPLSEWNPVAISHSSENEQGLADTVNLDAYVDDSGNMVVGSRWRSYLESQEMGSYEIIRQSGTSISQCWTGDEGMDQNPDYNYCVARIKEKGKDEEKTLWAVFERGEKTSKEVSFADYPKFSPVQWAFTNLAFVESYCGDSEIINTAAQAEQANPSKNFFNPGSIHQEYMVTPIMIYANITNGLGEKINLLSLKSGTCEMNFEDEIINDHERRLYKLKECDNGLEGETFTGELAVTYSREGKAQEESLGQISQAIAEQPEEDIRDSGETAVPLPDPCTGCVGVVHGYGGTPSLTWSGSEYGVAWNYDMGTKSRLYFARMDAEGNKIGDELRVKDTQGTAGKPSVALADDGYAILWPAGDKLYFQKISSEGAADGEAVDISGGSAIGSASIVWTGSGYGAAWQGDSKTYFAMLDAQGNKIGNVSEVGLVSSQTPFVVWEGSEYGVVWVENTGAGRKIYLKRFDEQGELMGTISIVNDYIFCDDVDLSWANQNYGIAYRCIEDNRLTDMDKSDIYFMRVHSTGGRTEMVELDFGIVEMSNTNTSSRNPSIVLSSENYGMVWEDSRDGNSEIYFAWLDTRTGTKREDETRFTMSLAESLDASLVHTGSEYGVVWTENSEGQVDLWFGKFE